MNSPGPTRTISVSWSPLDEDGEPRGPFAAGEVPNIQKPGPPGPGARVNEGQTVLTNGINVGHRGGTPAAPGALAGNADMLDVTAGQGLPLPVDQRGDDSVLPIDPDR